MEVENSNPNIYKICDERSITAFDEDDAVVDPFDDREIFGKKNQMNQKKSKLKKLKKFQI